MLCIIVILLGPFIEVAKAIYKEKLSFFDKIWSFLLVIIPILVAHR